MKDINPSGFLLLLNGSFPALLIRAKSHSNRVVKAPNLTSILGTADH